MPFLPSLEEGEMSFDEAPEYVFDLRFEDERTKLICVCREAEAAQSPGEPIVPNG